MGWGYRSPWLNEGRVEYGRSTLPAKSRTQAEILNQLLWIEFDLIGDELLKSEARASCWRKKRVE